MQRKAMAITSMEEMKICPDVVFPNNFSFCFMAPPVAYGPAHCFTQIAGMNFGTASSYQIHMVKSKDMHQEEKIVEFYKKIVWFLSLLSIIY